MKTASAIAALTLFATVSVQAATVDQISGEIYERGNNGGFHRLARPTEVQTGDTVMASANSSAEIVFGNGCRIRVEPGQTVVVPEGCGAAVAEAAETVNYGVVALGAAAIATGIYFAIRKENQPSPLSP